MKLINKYTLLFLITYFVSSIFSTWLLYSWTAFGGDNSMSFFQKAIFLLFKFPSSYININGFIFSIFINSIFWSAIFYFTLRFLIKKNDSNMTQ